MLFGYQYYLLDYGYPRAWNEHLYHHIAILCDCHTAVDRFPHIVSEGVIEY